MKKTMLYLAALACCLFSLTSCGDDEPDVMANGSYTITFGTDFFKAADFVIIYYKAVNGDTKREVVNSGTTWTKTITTKVPAEFGFKIEIEPREELTVDQQFYDISLKGSISSAISSGGTGKYENSETFITLEQNKDSEGNLVNGTEKSKVLSTLKANMEKTYGYRLDKDGKPTHYTPSFD